MQKTGLSPKIVIVVPTYNEGAVLRNVVEGLLAFYPVIVVDDGSATPAGTLLAGLPVTVLRHRTNLGQGAALQTGFLYAAKQQADVAITFDADGQHDPGDLSALIQPIVEGQADVVLGSRFLVKNSLEIPFSKRMVLFIARFINLLLTGLLLSDAHNGLRALNRKALNAISITENGMAHATEILSEVKHHGLRYIEIPVHIQYTDYSKEKGQSAWDSIKVLFDLVLHKFFK